MDRDVENSVRDDEEDTRRLVVAITDFLRDQLIARTDLVLEDRDCLEIAIQCLEMAYNLEARRYMQYRFARPLLDVFNQVTNPVSIRDKLRAEAHKDEGNNYMRRSMFSNAEEEYTRAIELDRWNAIYYCNRASSRIEQSNFFDAISDCRQALMLNPDYAKAHARMGQAYALIHRPREAARCFGQALELDPSNERYRNNLRVAESQINRPDAMGFLTTLLGSLFGMTPSNPDDPSPSMNLPTSFMIITESHPPTREDPGECEETTGTSQQDESSQTDVTERKSVTSDSSTEAHNIRYPQPYGVIDEGAEERPILQIDLPESTDMEELLAGDEDCFVQIFDLRSFPPTPPPSDEEDDETTSKQKTGTEEKAKSIDPDELSKKLSSEEKSSKQETDKEKQTIERNKGSRAESNQHSDTAMQGIPSTSVEPPRFKMEYSADDPRGQIIRDGDHSADFKETPKEREKTEDAQSNKYDSSIPITHKTEEKTVKSTLNDTALTASGNIEESRTKHSVNGSDSVISGAKDGHTATSHSTNPELPIKIETEETARRSTLNGVTAPASSEVKKNTDKTPAEDSASLITDGKEDSERKTTPADTSIPVSGVKEQSTVKSVNGSGIITTGETKQSSTEETVTGPLSPNGKAEGSAVVSTTNDKASSEVNEKQESKTKQPHVNNIEVHAAGVKEESTIMKPPANDIETQGSEVDKTYESGSVLPGVKETETHVEADVHDAAIHKDKTSKKENNRNSVTESNQQRTGNKSSNVSSGQNVNSEEKKR